MVRPVLKCLHSPDVPDIDTNGPENPRCFGILIQAMFGPDGADGEESFDIIVCTPKWLERETAEKGIMLGLHHLIVYEYDIKQIRTYLTKFAESCCADTWSAAAAKLARLGHWEFDDYTPFITEG